MSVAAVNLFKGNITGFSKGNFRTISSDVYGNKHKIFLPGKKCVIIRKKYDVAT